MLKRVDPLRKELKDLATKAESNSIHSNYKEEYGHQERPYNS